MHLLGARRLAKGSASSSLEPSLPTPLWSLFCHLTVFLFFAHEDTEQRALGSLAQITQLRFKPKCAWLRRSSEKQRSWGFRALHLHATLQSPKSNPVLITCVLSLQEAPNCFSCSSHKSWIHPSLDFRAFILNLQTVVLTNYKLPECQGLSYFQHKVGAQFNSKVNESTDGWMNFLLENHAVDWSLL